MAYKRKGYDAGRNTGSNRNIGMSDADRKRLQEIKSNMGNSGVSEEMYQKLAAEKRAIEAKYNNKKWYAG